MKYSVEIRYNVAGGCLTADVIRKPHLHLTGMEQLEPATEHVTLPRPTPPVHSPNMPASHLSTLIDGIFLLVVLCKVISRVGSKT